MKQERSRRTSATASNDDWPHDAIAVMLTMTTYGTWLRGDRRGWVEHGVEFPPDPELEQANRARMKHAPFRFPEYVLRNVGGWMIASLRSRLEQRILALTVQSWHVHLMLIASNVPPPQIAKCAKDAVRWGLRAGRPLWTCGYDKRYCFSEVDVLARIRYVERHNSRVGWPARPWPEIEAWP